MDWTLVITFIAGLYIGSNIPKAIEQWKTGWVLVKQKEKERYERLHSTR